MAYRLVRTSVYKRGVGIREKGYSKLNATTIIEITISRDNNHQDNVTGKLEINTGYRLIRCESDGPKA